MNRGGLYNVNPMAIGDIFWNVSGFTASRLAEKAGDVPHPADATSSWFTVMAITILGFLAYRLLIDSWLRTENFVSGAAKVAFDDVLRWTTILAVVQLLTGGTLYDPIWISNTGLFVGSLVFYDLLAHNFVENQTRHLEPNVALGIRDVVKYGFALSLNNFLARGSDAFDKNWLISTSGALAGIAIYDIFLAKYLAEEIVG